MATLLRFPYRNYGQCLVGEWRFLPRFVSIEILRTHNMATQQLSSNHRVNKKMIYNNTGRFYSTDDQPKLNPHLSSAEKATATEDAIPFLHSRAHTFKVKDTYSTDSPKDKRRQKYAIPLGLFLSGVLFYLGFVREYGEKDRERVDFLTKDISEKLPEDVRKKVYDELENNDIEDSPADNDS